MVSLHDSPSSPTAGIRHTEQGVDFYCESRKVASGTLYVTDEYGFFISIV